MSSAKTITPKELANELGTDAKTLRKFLREWAPTKEVDTPGQGGRWALTGRQAQEIRKAFANRTIAKRTAKEMAEDADAVDDEAVEVEGEGEEEVFEDLEDEEVEA